MVKKKNSKNFRGKMKCITVYSHFWIKICVVNKTVCLTDTILSSAAGSSAHGKVWLEMPLWVDRYWVWHIFGALGTAEPEWTSELQAGKRRHCSVAVNLIYSCCDCEAAPWCCETCCLGLGLKSSSSISGTVVIINQTSHNLTVANNSINHSICIKSTFSDV